MNYIILFISFVIFIILFYFINKYIRNIYHNVDNITNKYIEHFITIM